MHAVTISDHFSFQQGLYLDSLRLCGGATCLVPEIIVFCSNCGKVAVYFRIVLAHLAVLRTRWKWARFCHKSSFNKNEVNDLEYHCGLL
jgi:hypothetical protein